MTRSTIYLTAAIAAAAAWWYWRRSRQPAPITKVNQGAAAAEHKSLPPSSAGAKFAGPKSGSVAGAGQPTDTSTRVRIGGHGPIQRGTIRVQTRGLPASNATRTNRIAAESADRSHRR
jgi:hypothetical protein